jgi:charged multivesicular body protein 2A
MGQMNRSLNLPQVSQVQILQAPSLRDSFQIQKIMNEFEKESATMDMKEEMMSDAVDDAMEGEDEGEGEDVESDKILKEVMDEIGMGMNDAVSWVLVEKISLFRIMRSLTF